MRQPNMETREIPFGIQENRFNVELLHKGGWLQTDAKKMARDLSVPSNEQGRGTLGLVPAGESHRVYINVQDQQDTTQNMFFYKLYNVRKGDTLPHPLSIESDLGLHGKAEIVGVVEVFPNIIIEETRDPDINNVLALQTEYNANADTWELSSAAKKLLENMNSNMADEDHDFSESSSSLDVSNPDSTALITPFESTSSVNETRTEGSIEDTIVDAPPIPIPDDKTQAA